MKTGTRLLLSVPGCHFNLLSSFRFYCEFSDEFMFTPQATLSALAIAVKNGGLTEDQQKILDENPNGNDGEDNADVVDNPPLCPWFTCCS